MTKRKPPPATDIAAQLQLRPGQSLALLKELHILTRDGRINQDSRRKLKQVNHLYQFIEPLLQTTMDAGQTPRLVDHGAGKSYLGFILYDLFLRSAPESHIWSVETRPELVTRAQALATQLDFERMHFLCCPVGDAGTHPAIPSQVDIVTALHACDTATDDAIRFALQKHARYIVLVPCCQAEVAAVLRQQKNQTLGITPLSELWRHPIHTREFASLLTNTLRCLLLQAHGYQISVTELVGWEHSMKNELIIGTRTGKPLESARARATQILQLCNLQKLNARFLY